MLIVPYNEELFDVIHRDFGLMLKDDAEDLPEEGILAAKGKKYIIFGLSDENDSRFICFSNKKHGDLLKTIKAEGYEPPNDLSTWNMVYDLLYNESVRRANNGKEMPI